MTTPLQMFTPGIVRALGFALIGVVVAIILLYATFKSDTTPIRIIFTIV